MTIVFATNATPCCVFHMYVKDFKIIVYYYHSYYISFISMFIGIQLHYILIFKDMHNSLYFINHEC